MTNLHGAAELVDSGSDARSHRPSAAFVPGVHAARALAVMLVLAAHVVGLWTNQEQFRYLPWQGYLKFIIDPFRIDHQAGGHMGLLLFFLVSGYIVSQAAESDGRTAFVVKRIARLGPAMILAVGATLAVASLNAASGVPLPLEFDPARAYSWHAIVEALGLAPVFGGNSILFVLWTLYVEIQWYTMLWLGGKTPSQRPVVSTVAFMLAAAVFGGFVPLIVGPLDISASITYVLVILIGRWIYLGHQGKVSALQAAAGVLACLALYGWMMWPAVGEDLLGGSHPRIAAPNWATIILVAMLRLVHAPLWRPVRFIGDVSYGIYLFHVPVMWLVLPVISPGGRLFTVGLLVTVGLVMVAAWASYRFVEAPVRHAARRALAAREARSQPAARSAAPGPATP